MLYWVCGYLLIGCGFARWMVLGTRRDIASGRIASPIGPQPAQRFAWRVMSAIVILIWPLLVVALALKGLRALARQRPTTTPVERPQTVIIDEDLWSVCCRMIDAARRRDLHAWRTEAPALQRGADTQNLWVYLTALLTRMECDLAGSEPHHEDVERILVARRQDWASVIGAPEDVFRDALRLAATGIPKEERLASQASSGDLLLAIAALSHGSDKTPADYRAELIAFLAGTELGEPST